LVGGFDACQSFDAFRSDASRAWTALSVKRRLRWLMAAMTVANVVLWTVVFGL
jgi:hypothetical protein